MNELMIMQKYTNNNNNNDKRYAQDDDGRSMLNMSVKEINASSLYAKMAELMKRNEDEKVYH